MEKSDHMYEQVGGNKLAKNLGNITANLCFVEQERGNWLEMYPFGLGVSLGKAPTATVHAAHEVTVDIHGLIIIFTVQIWLDIGYICCTGHRVYRYLLVLRTISQ